MLFSPSAFLGKCRDMLGSAHADRVAQWCFALACLMPLWLVIGRAWADIAVCIIAAAFILHNIFTKSWSWTQSWEARLLLLFWLYICVQSAWVAPHTQALFASLVFGRFLWFYLAMRFWLCANPAALRMLTAFALLPLSVMLADGFWQYFTGVSLRGQVMLGSDGERLTGLLSHPNFGNYLFKIGVPTLASMLFFSIGAPSMPLAPARMLCLQWAGMAVLGVAILTAIPLSGERSVTVMLLVALATFALLALFRAKHYRRQVIIGIGCVVALGAILSTQDVVMTRTLLLLDLLSHFSTTVYGQLLLGSELLSAKYPLLGIGAGQFYSECKTLQLAAQVTYCDIHPHNFYLQWLVETGMIGALFILAFIAVLCSRAIRIYARSTGRNVLSLALAMGAAAGLLFPLMITQSNFSNWPAAIFWFSLAWIVSLIAAHEVPAHD